MAPRPLDGLGERQLVANDDDATANILAALASPVRLRILSALVRPKLVSELRISADRGTGALAARQTLQVHLDKLEEAGLVQTVEIQRNGRPYRGYVARAATIRLAKVALRRVSDELDARGRTTDDGTLLMDADSGPQTPHLFVLQGADHVATFELPVLPKEARRWAIGRGDEAEFPIIEDPFVSRIHAYLEWTDEGFAVRDAVSANGTTVNGVRLAPGARVLLKHGDLIGLGRSYLVFRGK